METILSLFIFHDAYVVSFLVAAIMIIVLLLLMYNFKSPESVVMNEVNSGENIEGALRRVLGEQSWVGAQGEDVGDSVESLKKIGVLEQEVLTKDKEIAELHKQVTQGGNSGEAGSGNETELMAKIDELEGRLQEYEIIEDDIADLSLYKAENEKLKSQLQAQGGAAPSPEPEPVAAPVEEVAPVAEEEPAPQPVEDDEKPTPIAAVDWTEARDADEEEAGRDLVAEFEKVVNNKDAIVGEPDSMTKAVGDGDVIVKGQDSGSVDVIHPTLKDVKPDSKEEAEVFIADLKSLKKGS